MVTDYKLIISKWLDLSYVYQLQVADWQTNVSPKQWLPYIRTIHLTDRFQVLFVLSSGTLDLILFPLKKRLQYQLDGHLFELT